MLKDVHLASPTIGLRSVERLLASTTGAGALIRVLCRLPVANRKRGCPASDR